MLMRKRVALGMLAVAALAAAGGAPLLAQAPTTPQEEAEHEALRGLRAIYEQAVDDDRLDLLQPHLHAEFTGVMVTGRHVANFDEVRAYWRDIGSLIGEGGRYTTSVKPEWTTLFGDVALARGTTDDVVVTSEGQEFRFQTFWTAVLQKDEGRWKIRRLQGSMDPITNPFVREFTRRTVIRSGVIGGILGVLLGVVLTLVVWRRKTRAATP